jgi:hypothetical protein
MTSWNTRRLSLLALGTAAALSACSQDENSLTAVPARPDLAVSLEASSASVPAGERIAIAVRADAVTGEAIGGMQGYLRFDPSRLQYVGHAASAKPFVIANGSAAGQGEVRALSMDAAGMPSRAMVLVFEVKGADYLRGVSFELEAAATRDVKEIGRPGTVRGVVPVSDMAVPVNVRQLTLDDLNRELYPDLLAKEAVIKANRPLQAPGEYRLNLVFGDATLTGGNANCGQAAGPINVLDASYIANVAVGNSNIIIGTNSPDRDAVVAGNVAPANLPGLGEPNDANPPGRETNGTRVINVFDALAIQNEAVGNPRDIVCDLIPGRGPVATNRVVVSGNITTATTWTRNNIYELAGIVRVNGGGVLTIEPGTRVEGQSTQTSALFIERDGQIQASGTPLEPIVFSCTATTKTKGCWSGLWIAGNAPINEGATTSPAIRNSVGGCSELQGEGNGPFFGGCDPLDDSGVLRYAVIEYAGFILAANVELNGLTVGGVGSNTDIEFIQVHAGLDDGYEIFGGTHNTRNILLTGNSDDSFDFANGWNGSAQFIIVQHDSLDSDKGFEVDNTGNVATYDNLPRTVPNIFNVTLIGKNDPAGTGGPAANNSEAAFHLRRGARPHIFNWVALGWDRVLDLDDAPTSVNLGTDLELENGCIGTFARLDESDGGDALPAPYVTEADFINDAAFSNNTACGTVAAGSVLLSPIDVILPDFRPVNATVVAGGATPPSNGFFDVTATYRGAVAPANSTRSNIPWYSGWTRGWQSSTQP